MSTQNPRTRFNKLTLKRNKTKLDIKVSDMQSQSLEAIILEDSFDRLRAQADAFVKSPIVIDDSSEMSNMSLSAEIPKVTIRKCPSKFGNASFNCTQSDTSITEVPPSRPSIGGWSPAQSIICATPRYKTIPTTPKDKANESMEQCTIKKIQQSQKKLLNDLYGEVWKSIPKLFKPTTPNNLDVVAKKLQFNDQDVEKENIREAIAITKQLYLTDSDAKHKVKKYQDDTEKKSKKRLYTVVPNTPDLTKLKNLKNTKCEELSTTPDPVKKKTIKVKRDVNTTGKKLKGKSVTELVEIMKEKFISESDQFSSESDRKFSKSDKFNSESDKISSKSDKFISESTKLDVNSLVRRVKNIRVSPVSARMTFIGSLADNVPSYRCHTEAINYRDNFKSLKEKLTRRLFEEFNETVFGRELDNDMSVAWDTKLRSTAGTTTNRLIKNSKGERIRSSSIKLSVKVLDNPERLRDTLIHELCHAATWVIDHELRAGHGPIWKKWAKRALKVYPELGEISRCHDMVIHFKYTYRCTRCGYSIQRHSKSIDITKKCCGYCRGTFEVVLNRKNKDGAVVSTPARKGEVNGFAKYVKENYSNLKTGRSHAQVMKVLGEQFASNRNKDHVKTGV